MKIFFEIDGVLTEMITCKQAAYHLKYAMRTVRQFADEGKLIAINVDGRLWVSRQSVEICLMRRDEISQFQAL